MKTELWEILVPTTYNDGKPVRVRHHRVWDANVRAITGGLTIMKPAKGQWICPEGQLYSERMIPVRFAVASQEQVRKIMQLTCFHYDQLAVMATRVSDCCLILDRQELLGKKPMWRKAA